MNTDIIKTIELSLGESVTKIDAKSLGSFYILGGFSTPRAQLFNMFMDIVKEDIGRDLHKHHSMTWKRIDNYAIVYYTSLDNNELFKNQKTDFIDFNTFLKGRFGLAISKRSDKYRLQMDDSRYYKIVLSFDIIYKAMLDCMFMKLPLKNRFVDSLEIFDKLMGEHSFYRGHSSYSYELRPSLFRGNYEQHEAELFQDFKKFCSRECKGKTDLEIMSLMQHNGLPTRLLDITTDKYVALFMACSTVFGDSDGINDIGEVYGFDPVKTYSQDSFIIDRLSNAYDKDNIADSDNLDIAYFLEYKETEDNERKKKQKGSFIMFSKNEPLIVENTSVYIINKEHILEELDKKGYNEMTLVPEMKHICHFIRQKYK